MGTINNLRRKFEALDIDKVARKSMENTTEEMANIQAEQMMHGFNSFGNKIGQYKLEPYAEKKNRMNPLPGFGVPDLKLTGAFYRGINVKISGEMVITDSSNIKSEGLQKRYGPEIYGLDEQYKGEFLREALQPEFGSLMEQETGLKMS